MTFLYPLGLLGLIGIPVLIIIYIIKNKYTEQTVSSTYLWTLSERFLKRRNPFNKLAGIISLILQILAVALISLVLAHPVMVLPGAANDYCFILDASGSMNMVSEGKTRFDLGKEHISAIIEEAVDGSTYSLIYVGESTGVVFERLESKEQATLLLGEVKPTHSASTMVDAIGAAQGYFNENPAQKTYLVTDKAYASQKNIEVINVSRGEENYAVTDLTCTAAGGQLTVGGSVISYENDATLTVDLYLNGGREAVATQTVAVTKLTATPVTFTYPVANYYSAKLVIRETDAQALDSECILYNVEQENAYSTLLVSDTPFLLRAVLAAVGNTNVTVVSPADYQPASGYGLYIFDSYNPGEMPRDGTVWLINLDSSLPDAGFSVQGEVAFETGEQLSLTTSSATIARKLTEGLTGEGVTVKGYIRYGLYRNFTALYSYAGNPVIFTGTNTHGNREVVFAFDLHQSDFAVSMDYVTLTKNLLDYSFPTVIEEVSYDCGHKAEINVISGTESIRVDSPLGNVTYLETGDAISQFALYEVGVYTVTVTVAGSPRQFYVYSELQEAERLPTVEEGEIALQGEASSVGRDGRYDNLMWLFITLAVVFAADWMVYCYDKYQLR